MYTYIISGAPTRRDRSRRTCLAPVAPAAAHPVSLLSNNNDNNNEPNKS